MREIYFWGEVENMDKIIIHFNMYICFLERIKQMNVANFTKLYSIFSTKDWHSKKDYNDNVFENFCKLLSNLNEKQQSLILELTERYVWLSVNEYNSTLIKIFNSIPNDEVNLLKRIFLFPIVRTEEEFKTKSGHGILFMLRGIKPLLAKFQNIIFKEVEQFNYFETNPKIKDDELIFLLDDFLGSGSTISSTIQELNSYGISNDQIRIISIAAHNQAITYLDSLPIKYYIDLIMTKGISEHYAVDILSEKVDIMNQIEKLLPTSKYNFGYSKSEALITLYRTPNNTFPIFWLDHKKDEVNYKAPFPRF
jgi:hypothetical protein